MRSRELSTRILSFIEEFQQELTIGDLIVIHQKVDTFLNERLDLLPISDSLDLRSYNVRSERHTGESLDLNLEESGVRNE